MNFRVITNFISVRISNLLPHRWTGDRKIDQVIDPESGSLYELFANKDGSLTVWQTDPDGISTLWDCNDSPNTGNGMNASAFQFCCN